MTEPRSEQTPERRPDNPWAKWTTVLLHSGYAFLYGLLLLLSLVVLFSGQATLYALIGALLFGWLTFRSLRSSYLRATRHRDDLRTTGGRKLGSWE